MGHLTLIGGGAQHKDFTVAGRGRVLGAPLRIRKEEPQGKEVTRGWGGSRAALK